MRSALVASLALAASTAVAADKPAGVAITPTSDDAAIILRVDQVPAGRALLEFARYDDAAHAIPNNLGGGFFDLDLNGAKDGWRVKRLKPGTYVVKSYRQQDQWTSCFHAETVAFRIAAGQVIYLGTFDIVAAATDLRNQVLAAGQGRAMRNQMFFYLDGIRPPVLRIDDDLQAARTWSVKAMPKTQATPEAVHFTPATFTAGKGLFGNRVCFGPR